MCLLLTSLPIEHITEFIAQYDLVLYIRHFMQVVFCVWIAFVVTALVSIIITAGTDRGGR
jgi:hypothetical protein